MTYAFLEPALGPERRKGVMLYRISDTGQTPSIAWWPSARAYFSGGEGIGIFDDMTRENVEREYPDIVVFHDRHSAMQAWALNREHKNIMRLYLGAIDVFLQDMGEMDTEEATYDLLRRDMDRGRHWLFGASHVTCGAESELAWLAHKVFI